MFIKVKKTLFLYCSWLIIFLVNSTFALSCDDKEESKNSFSRRPIEQSAIVNLPPRWASLGSFTLEPIIKYLNIAEIPRQTIQIIDRPRISSKEFFISTSSYSSASSFRTYFAPIMEEISKEEKAYALLSTYGQNQLLKDAQSYQVQHPDASKDDICKYLESQFVQVVGTENQEYLGKERLQKGIEDFINMYKNL
ncbi:MAG: hypothetical protein ACRYGR_09515 [Janthinobacterium lividum]